jgi:Xaa-Pro aminopeptidase
VDAAAWFCALRERKSPSELDRLRRAGRLLDEARDRLATLVRPGMREVDTVEALCTELDHLGSEGPHFALSSSGPATATEAPRLDAVPSSRTMAEGDLLWLEFNARVDAYSAHAMATIAVGAVPGLERAERAAARVRRDLLGVLRAGAGPAEFAQVRQAHEARGIRFAKPLVHSIGMATPDLPLLDPLTGVAVPLDEGMTMALEIEAAPPAGPWVCFGGSYVIRAGGARPLHRVRWTSLHA